MNYRFHIALPVALLVVCIALFFIQMNSGLNLDVDLKGGTQITGDLQSAASEQDIERALSEYSANVRMSGDRSVFISVDSSVDANDIIMALDESGHGLADDYSVQTVGAALGSSFFSQAIMVLGFAFVFMAITVFIIFKNPMPSFFVVLCAAADILETLVISQLVGIQLSLATFTSLLLLLGYSVDDNILLTTKVFKEEGESKAKISKARKTGFTMMGATIAALAALFLIQSSPVIAQIASVLLIGLVVDLANTWLLNAPLIRMYHDNKVKI